MGSCSDCVAVSNCCVDSNSGWKLDMVEVFPGDWRGEGMLTSRYAWICNAEEGCLKLDTALSTSCQEVKPVKSRQHQNTASKHQTPRLPKQPSVHRQVTPPHSQTPCRPDTILVMTISTRNYLQLRTVTAKSLSNNAFY